MLEEKYMELALKLAQKGNGWTNPNPMVGAVIVKNGRIIGQGYHEKYGQLHAERNALSSCSESAEGATMYVTLEPCCHYGKTPPCTEAIIENKIKKVVIGSTDPNELVAGKGIKQLEEAGIEVVVGMMKEQCDALNHIFFNYIKEKKPFVAMKYAMTLDGKIATYSGKSKWITSEEAREHVHGLRHQYMGIMVGIGTVLKDNPMLDCRLPNTKNPIRIICDTTLQIPMESQLVQTAKEIVTYVATASSDTEKIKQLEEANCKVLNVHIKDGHINLQNLIERLGAEKIDSILLEGGGMLNYAALESGLVDHVYCYIAPKLFGGAQAVSPVEGLGVENPDQAFLLENQKITSLGQDVLLEFDVKRGE
ncbi:bifunctional diaminohydroxyphosphoribosylaminopyrimidine deaminase/5-amino-6-(5-phosphoribosylamino)uracil reductase RibD [Clostridium aminobutyricum]|uniref:Riboflavin biosynthesis protein RibD n=1 Tax=Clostridium aminobutyricum TaxID=33953 RepID=A0A939D6W7_CLOAM|nr:bifunctional diaminohydroxyphosphoribosylaminopyrimidine deaminase/5-amino-6-(5-phosphoribosylamino)uracil reductase RibD [Clostridium aminobutyricum]MBN7772171.1 bifunctional diaminohydroxyphosphoribosylaminopyrimidine deaminase/5-amino-6-(5-phosphoribosylamino)uracil reductase RibD [Clostridium aminobutyricum]